MRQPNRACWIIDHAGHVLPFSGYRGDAGTIRYHTYEGSKQWHAGPPGGQESGLLNRQRTGTETGLKSPVSRPRDRLMDFTMPPPVIA